ncbi:hypothetical protein [Rhodococcus sp. NPDC058521]|uniref:hypothetical protein n=1 Tax=Rhodococcus sp. NPDC058521 TaxID=3346536 RepID=UPI003656F9F1
MSRIRMIRRVGAVAAIAATGTLGLPAIASAVPFENQPMPIGCADGMGQVHGVTHTENAKDVPPEKQYYIIGENGGGAGANVNWLNLNTFQGGGAPLVPAPFIGESTAPQAMGVTGPGQVVSVVHGAYTNSKGQTCFLFPGWDFADVPPAPPEAETPAE